MNKKIFILILSFIACRAFAELTNEEKLVHVEVAGQTFLREAKPLMQGFQAFYLKCKEYEAEIKELQAKLKQAKQENQELEKQVAVSETWLAIYRGLA